MPHNEGKLKGSPHMGWSLYLLVLIFPPEVLAPRPPVRSRDLGESVALRSEESEIDTWLYKLTAAANTGFMDFSPLLPHAQRSIDHTELDMLD